MKIWRLNKGADRRIRAGHPWVFSNELSESPKGHEPGAPVKLLDFRGEFLAYGYGNPHSLIAFRALSFDAVEENFFKPQFLQEKILRSWWARASLGYRYSFRMNFGEADYFPGLVVDYYRVENGQIFSVQVLTAGAQLFLGPLEDFFREVTERAQLQGLSEFSWSQSALLVRNDVAVRKLEGLTYDEAKVTHDPRRLLTGEEKILLHSPMDWSQSTAMHCDLVHGQKTGFFLDQAWNIQIVADLLKHRAQHGKELRILDLCCYVGQWSTKIGLAAEKLGYKTNVTLVDVSKQALDFAEKNVRLAGISRVETFEMDVMQDLARLPDRGFDIVIADPPAFVKAKKDLPIGTHAYLKLNTHGFRLLRNGGWLISCSCSGLFTEADMTQVLAKAARRDGREVRCIAKGGHAPDHPVLTTFSEGFYLKMFLHQVAGGEGGVGL